SSLGSCAVEVSIAGQHQAAIRIDSISASCKAVENGDRPGGRKLEHYTQVVGTALDCRSVKVPITALDQRSDGAMPIVSVKGELNIKGARRSDLENISGTASARTA